MKRYLLAISLISSGFSACSPQAVNDVTPTPPSQQPPMASTRPDLQAPVTSPTPSASIVIDSSAQPSLSPTTQTPQETPPPSPAVSETSMPLPEPAPTVNSTVPTPLNLRVTDRTATNISVNWTSPDTDEPVTYNLYLNDTQVASNLEREFHTFTDLNPSTSYVLTIETVTTQGLSPKLTINSSTGSVGSSSGGSSSGSGAMLNFVQVERLARPAINEGLIRQDTPERAQLLRTWNSVPPSVDLADIQAAADIRTEAVTVLSALQSQVQAALGYDNTAGKPVRDSEQQATRIGQIAGVFLPDVMRIDTTGPSGYAMGITDLSAPRPFRGRRIDDDVIDITLAVLVPGGALDPLDPGQGFIDRVETDNVEYDDLDENMARIHDPISNEFPYLAAPN